MQTLLPWGKGEFHLAKVRLTRTARCSVMNLDPSLHGFKVSGRWTGAPGGLGVRGESVGVQFRGLSVLQEMLPDPGSTSKAGATSYFSKMHLL